MSSAMLSRILLCFFLMGAAAPDEDDFFFNGFRGAHLSLDGAAEITPEGLLRLTNSTAPDKSHVFFGDRIRFKADPAGTTVFSFSTTFVFGIVPLYLGLSGHGIAFFVSPSRDLQGTIGSQYMGLFNTSSNGNPSNHIFSVELDTVRNPEFGDIDENHAGIDINSMRSYESRRVGYYANSSGSFEELSLTSGRPIQAWVEYDGRTMQLNVTVAPMEVAKPSMPLLSSTVNLSGVLLDQMYVGFASSSNTFLSSHYLMGWSFRMNGTAQALNISSLPALPQNRAQRTHTLLSIWLPLSVTAVVAAVAGIAILVRRRIKYAELLEDWERDYRHHRFSYKELFDATHGFDDRKLLGEGGFGRVYRGVLPSSKVQVAIKRVSHESSHGMKQFIAEIVSIGRLRHRNIVQFLGYCRRKGELLLVYNLMPGGSLDKRLFDQAGLTLDWKQRLRIIKDVAAGLLYLHEEWEKVVIHRDVKASNVLLDGELNGRLGDFGLARLYDHGSDPQRTLVVGTVGYLAPEMIRTRRATKATDVFAFGVFLLEVACGRRPVDPKAPEEELVLVDRVLRCWRSGRILQVADPKLREYMAEEVEMVLKLGLLCCDPLPGARPSMRQVVLFLEGDLALPPFGSSYLNSGMMALMENEALDTGFMSCSPDSASLLYVGR